MAHILIVTANTTQRRRFAAVLKAAGHHVVTTDDAVLALAALHERAQPLIVLLGEQVTLLNGEPYLSGRELLVHALKRRGHTLFDQRHTYLLLTSSAPEALSAGVRALLASGRVTLLSPSCSIGELLGAIEDATERLGAAPTTEPTRATVAVSPQSRQPAPPAVPRQSDVERQVIALSAELRQGIDRLQQTATATHRLLNLTHDAIDQTTQTLRTVKRRTHLPPACAAAAAPTAHAHAIPDAGASSVGVC